MLTHKAGVCVSVTRVEMILCNKLGRVLRKVANE
jgi:hypothetical protein